MKNLMRFYLALAVAFLALTGTLYAQDKTDAPISRAPTVVELFTSQGCPGCPSADALLKRTRERSDVLVLSWAIDYWDRLGWEDTFAKPEHSKRQAGYNKQMGVAGVFTPEAIIDGQLWCKGADKTALNNKIERAQKVVPLPFTMTLSQKDDKIRTTLPQTKLPVILTIRVVWFTADAMVQIEGGVNEGRNLHYTNVVRASWDVGDWDGEKMDVALALKDAAENGADHVALLLADSETGKIYSAASLKIN